MQADKVFILYSIFCDMDRCYIKIEEIFDNEYITEMCNKRMLKLSLEIRDEYENAKRDGIRVYEKGKLGYKPMLDKIR